MTESAQSQVVDDLVAACLDFFYGDQEGDWTPDTFAKCQPVLAARFVPILEAWSGPDGT